MTLDEGILHDVEAASRALEELEDQAYEARAGLHQAIRRLHSAGGSMREVATALGMSHQRVHQIIGEEGIVEVEIASTEVGRLPVPAPTTHDGASLAITAGADSCSLCGAPRRELEKLLAAPGPVFICSSCVDRVTGVLDGRHHPGFVAVPSAGDATCSFCRNSSAVVGEMVEGEEFSLRMCGRCAATCRKLIAQDEPRKVMARRSSKVRCSFCNVSQADTKKLIAGPGVYICEGCISAASQIGKADPVAKGPRQVVLRDATSESHACAFCGQLPAQVKRVVKGGRGRICDECLDLCNEMLRKEGVAN